MIICNLGYLRECCYFCIYNNMYMLYDCICVFGVLCILCIFAFGCILGVCYCIIVVFSCKNYLGVYLYIFVFCVFVVVLAIL